jgi:hypothetical protein
LPKIEANLNEDKTLHALIDSRSSRNLLNSNTARNHRIPINDTKTTNIVAPTGELIAKSNKTKNKIYTKTINDVVYHLILTSQSPEVPCDPGKRLP